MKHETEDLFLDGIAVFGVVNASVVVGWIIGMVIAEMVKGAN